MFQLVCKIWGNLQSLWGKKRLLESQKTTMCRAENDRRGGRDLPHK